MIHPKTPRIPKMKNESNDLPPKYVRCVVDIPEGRTLWLLTPEQAQCLDYPHPKWRIVWLLLGLAVGSLVVGFL